MPAIQNGVNDTYRRRSLKMSKVIAASMVLVLAVGAAAFGDPNAVGLIQKQMTQMSVGNSINLLHGSQLASSIQNLCVNNNQQGTGICDAHACQSLLALITESGTAAGDCALIGLAQGLTVAGNQQQAVSEGVGPAGEAQGLGMQATQALGRTDGAGGATGVHAIVLNALQNAGNPGIALGECSSVIGLQNANVGGAPASTSLVEGSMTVVTTQSQGTLQTP
jgi:hypothetical protein